MLVKTALIIVIILPWDKNLPFQEVNLLWILQTVFIQAEIFLGFIPTSTPKDIKVMEPIPQDKKDEVVVMESSSKFIPKI